MILANFLTSSQRLTEACSESRQTSKIELIAEIYNDFKQLTIFAKCSILDVKKDSEYIDG